MLLILVNYNSNNNNEYKSILYEIFQYVMPIKTWNVIIDCIWPNWNVYKKKIQPNEIRGKQKSRIVLNVPFWSIQHYKWVNKNVIRCKILNRFVDAQCTYNCVIALFWLVYAYGGRKIWFITNEQFENRNMFQQGQNTFKNTHTHKRIQEKT